MNTLIELYDERAIENILAPDMNNRYHRHNRRFACSIGEVSSAIIQKYIENQGQCVSTNKAPPTA